MRCSPVPDPRNVVFVDAFHGGYVPFHLLTREFYTLVKERLAPGGAAVFNVHDGTKLYVSTVKTLGGFLENSHQHVQFLSKKAALIEEYLKQH